MTKLNLTLDSAAEKPLYLQLYDFLTEQIRSGELKAGEKLPGKRSMASALGVSVNTVDTAYQMLTAEGFVESRERSGFTVMDSIEQLPGEERSAFPQGRAAGGAADNAPERPAFRYDLTTSRVDTALFPSKAWARLQRDLLYNADYLLEQGSGQGDLSLRLQLAEYLSAYRGVYCTAEQIVIGAGVEYLTGLLAGILPGRTAAVENPGYKKAEIILHNNGIACYPAAVDEGGLQLKAVRAVNADLCYVTPSHQFPTGAVMPVGRRADLLRWAMEREERYILEGVYDSEFRFDVRPLPSLQGMSGSEGRVVYLSTFSRCLAPGIRIAYMVLPPALLEAYHARYGLYSCTVGRVEQQTLARFMESGQFTRHLARMRNAYKHRCRLLTDQLNRAFPTGALRLSGSHTGIHLLLQLNGGPGEAAMVQRAAEAGIRLTGISRYYSDPAAPCPENTVLLGYGGLNDEDIPAVVTLLRDCWCR